MLLSILRVGNEGLDRIERAMTELRRLSDSRRVHEGRMRTLRLGLSRTELRFLHRLDELGPLPVSRLADALDVSQPTASRSLHRLEDDGLVARQPGTDDGRVAVYTLTAKGRRTRRRVADLSREQLAGVLSDLSAARVKAMADALEELVSRLHHGPATATKETA